MPPVKTMLRVAIALEFLLIVAYFAVPSLVELQLPEHLRVYLDRGDETGWAPPSLVTSIVSIPLSVIHLVSAVALWFFRRWARLPYAVSSVWACVGPLFGGPLVIHPFEYAMEESWILISGFVTALLYYAQIEWSTVRKA